MSARATARRPPAHLFDLLRRTAGRFPDAPAIVRGEATLYTFAELSARAARLGSGLRKVGVRVGERVGLLLDDAAELYPILFAAWYAGLTPVLLRADRPEALAESARDAALRACFVSPELALEHAPALAAAGRPTIIDIGAPAHDWLLATEPAYVATPPDTRDTLAMIIYTSGSVGRPKGVMLSHGNLLDAVFRYLAEVEAVDPRETLVHLGVSAATAIVGLCHVSVGARQRVPDRPGLDPAERLALIATTPRARLVAVPALVRALVDSARQQPGLFDGLASLVYGSAPMYRDDIRAAVDVFGDRLTQLYGLSEIPGGIAHLDGPAHRRVAASDALAPVGALRPDVEARVLDDAGAERAPGQIGRLHIRAPTVARGYWRDPHRAALTFRGGWLDTGDLVAIDPAGLLTHYGRADDRVDTPAGPLYPRALEDHLTRHPAVAECAIVGVPRADRPRLVALVRLAGAPLDRAALDRALDPAGATLDAYRVVDALPYTPTGKLDREALRRLAAAAIT